MEATNKRHIFLTGDRGSGKTTLFRQLREQLSAPDITTFAQPGQCVYLREGNTDTVIGVYDESLAGKENKMRPVEEGFREGVQALTRLMQTEGQWAAIDEIGYLETEPYQNALTELMERKRLLAVVRRPDTPFLKSLLSRDDALVVDLGGHSVGCVIMASGLGTRFGGNKLMATLGGKPLIAWALDATEGVFKKRVVVTRHEDVARLCEERNVPVVLHDLPYRSDTVRLGLEALDEVHGCLFLPGDQPFVKKESLFAMVLAARNQNAIWQLGGASPVLFPDWAFEELKSLPQGKGGGVVVKTHGDRVCSLSESVPWELQDIDTRQDLARFAAGMCCMQ